MWVAACRDAVKNKSVFATHGHSNFQISLLDALDIENKFVIWKLLIDETLKLFSFIFDASSSLAVLNLNGHHVLLNFCLFFLLCW